MSFIRLVVDNTLKVPFIISPEEVERENELINDMHELLEQIHIVAAKEDSDEELTDLSIRLDFVRLELSDVGIEPEAILNNYLKLMNIHI